MISITHSSPWVLVTFSQPVLQPVFSYKTTQPWAFLFHCVLKEVIAAREGQKFVSAPCSCLQRNEDRGRFLEEVFGRGKRTDVRGEREGGTR